MRLRNVSLNVPVMPFRCFPIDFRVQPSAAGIVVHSFPGDEKNEIGVLLDGSGFAQVAELGLPAPGPLLDLTVQLGDGYHRYVQLLGEILQTAADRRYFLGTVLVLAAGT